MQPIARPAARYAGPEQDMKLLNKTDLELYRPVKNPPAFSFIGKFNPLIERRKIIRKESLLTEEWNYDRQAVISVSHIPLPDSRRTWLFSLRTVVVGIIDSYEM